MRELHELHKKRGTNFANYRITRELCWLFEKKKRKLGSSREIREIRGKKLFRYQPLRDDGGLLPTRARLQLGQLKRRVNQWLQRGLYLEPEIVRPCFE